MKNKNLAHQKYRTESGELVPGATTVTSVMAKPALINKANQLGLQGIVSSKLWKEMADRGTLAHYFIECRIKNELPDTSDYTENDIKIANKCLEKWIKWESNNVFEPIASELQLVSKKYKYGGTIDLYCKLNQVETIIDIKTSKSCWGEHHTQVVAYRNLLIEHGYVVNDCRIIRIGQEDDEGFEDIVVGSYDKHWRRFLACLELYNANKDLGE